MTIICETNIDVVKGGGWQIKGRGGVNPLRQAFTVCVRTRCGKVKVGAGPHASLYTFHLECNEFQTVIGVQNGG